MTIVVWDGKTVAADSLACRDDLRCSKPFQKIRVWKGRVVAFIGSSGLIEPLLYWYDSGAKPDRVPTVVLEGDHTTMLVFSDERCFAYATDLPYGDELLEPTAWGAGREFAIGAMDAGCDAKRACEIAIARDIRLGGPVQVIDLFELQKEIAA